MAHKCIVYDLDGTLADTAKDLTAALNHALLQNAIEPVTVAQVRTLVGAGARKLIERALELRNVAANEDLIKTMIDQLLHFYGANICNHTTLFDQIPQTLQTLHDLGYKQAICTNKPEQMARLLVEQLGIAHFFCALTGGDTFPYRKPDPKHLFETIRRAACTPEKTIFVGDSLTDYSTAQNANIPVVMVPWGYILEADKPLLKDILLPSNASLLEAILQIKL